MKKKMYKGVALGALALSAGLGILPAHAQSRVNLEARIETPVRTIQAETIRARAEVQNAYQDRVEEYKEQRDLFLEARKEYRARQVESTEAQQAAFEERVRAYLASTVETMTQKLERIKAWATTHPRLTDDQKAEIVVEVDAQIAEIREGYASLEDASLYEMRLYAQALRNRVAKYNVTVKQVVQKATTYHLQTNWDGLKNIVERLEEKISQLEEGQINVEKAREMLDDIKKTLSSENISREAILEIYADLRSLVVHLKAAVQ